METRRIVFYFQKCEKPLGFHQVGTMLFVYFLGFFIPPFYLDDSKRRNSVVVVGSKHGSCT